MQTLRRELRTKFEEVLIVFQDKLSVAEREATAELLADMALQLRGFKTDEERPAYGLDWVLGHGQDITAHDVEAVQTTDKAQKKFEAAFGFGSLPWDSTSDWTSMRKFITEIYSRDPLAFGNYIVWRKSKEGKYAAMSNKQIRMNPKVFMDTGWFDFERNGDTHATTTNRPENPATDPQQLERDRATAERIKARRAAQQASV